MKLIFLGDEFDEEEMLEWITDPNVQAVSDQIEEVNRKMFEKIRSRNDNLVVFFCKFVLLMSMAIQVVEFSNGGYKIRKVFA